METQAQDLNTKLSAIDKALAQAKARKAAKDSNPPPAGDDVQTVTVQKSDTNKALKLAEREARRAQIAKEREEAFLRALRSHNCKSHGCAPICVAFDN